MCGEFVRTFRAYDNTRWFAAGWRRLAQKLDGEWKQAIRSDLARIADLLERPSVKHHTPNNEVSGGRRTSAGLTGYANHDKETDNG